MKRDAEALVKTWSHPGLQREGLLGPHRLGGREVCGFGQTEHGKNDELWKQICPLSMKSLARSNGHLPESGHHHTESTTGGYGRYPTSQNHEPSWPITGAVAHTLQALLIGPARSSPSSVQPAVMN